MKKIVLGCILAASAVAADFYSSKIIELYTSPDAKKAEGKLLPTNAFEITKDGAMSEVKIKGIFNEKNNNILYFTKEHRILVVAFGKKSNVNLEKGKDLGNGFYEATITAYAKKDELVDLQTSVEPLFATANEMFSENCGICHPLHPVNEFSANQWPAQFKAMETRTAIDKEDRQLVVQYLQKHAKDIK